MTVAMAIYTILDRRISVGLSVLFLRQANGTLPGFWNRLDWRGLVTLRLPNIGKLKGYLFLAKKKCKDVQRKKLVEYIYFFSSHVLTIVYDFYFIFIYFLWIFSIKKKMPFLKIFFGFFEFIVIFGFFEEKKALSRRLSPPQELEVCPRSGLYLLKYLSLSYCYY